jgi:hypothetical protein
MKRLNRTLALAALAAVISSAPPTLPRCRPNHAVLHVVTPYKGGLPLCT